MNTLEKLSFEKLRSRSQEAMAEWRAQGGKVVGYTCIYVPEEVIQAAGMLPVRIFGGLESSPKAESLLQVNLCSFVRSCLGEALEGRLEELDGLVAARTCSQIVKLYDLWELYLKPPFLCLLDHPHRISPLATSYYEKELRRFIQELAGYGKVQITEEALREAIVQCNEGRSLLRKIYELRHAPNPRLWGSEALQMVRAAMVLPKPEANRLLRELMEELSQRELSLPEGLPRLLVSGSMVDNPAFIQAVEEAGAVVVCDDLCLGTRYFWEEVPLEPAGDPIAALARHYVERIPCAHIYPRQKRFEHLRQLAHSFQVDGAILFTVKFCDTYVFDGPGCTEMLRGEGIPTLELDIEHSTVSVGQIRTRVQAFLEMLETNLAQR
ncbi:MAG: 2-hydroxyacyl-CoA dehydratase [Candidatus Tectomicrobia bacterium]|uniref:2-hydroxyacyl-CoA dehydratase n=1 Tax=Tectimicrobiota bacterium TaxID=2528274 RepID=A0A932CLW5_UNCTE|nr:2-hydroxyacyl-CoA dehydratase [Candidatus Tectomicrobia bacterium]